MEQMEMEREREKRKQKRRRRRQVVAVRKKWNRLTVSRVVATARVEAGTVRPSRMNSIHQQAYLFDPEIHPRAPFDDSMPI